MQDVELWQFESSNSKSELRARGQLPTLRYSAPEKPVLVDNPLLAPCSLTVAYSRDKFDSVELYLAVNIHGTKLASFHVRVQEFRD